MRWLKPSGWTLIELVLTCVLLAVVTGFAVSRLAPSNQDGLSVRRAAEQLKHAAEQARERALHDHTRMRLVIAKAPPHYLLEQKQGKGWAAVSEKLPLPPQIELSGHLQFEFLADGKATQECHLLLQQGTARREVIAYRNTGRTITQTP